MRAWTVVFIAALLTASSADYHAPARRPLRSDGGAGLASPPAAMPIAAMTPPAPGSGASPPPVHNGPANWIKVQAGSDGSFTVTNRRNGFATRYAAVSR